VSDTVALTEELTLTEVVLPGVVEPDGLVLRKRRVPTPQRRQVIVEMLASGVSFAEQSMLRNRYPGQPKYPFVPGYDLVGTVIAIGAGVEPDLLGCRVAAVVKTGGWSTHVAIDARQVVPVPDTPDPAEIEAVLVNGITAWQMLHRHARVPRGRTILLHGASGGVGLILAQLAREAGVRVIGTASPRNHDTLRELGVEPLDYHDADLSAQIRALAPDGIDAAFDNIDAASFRDSFGLLRRGGVLVAYGFAAQLDDTNNPVTTFIGVLSRFAWWSLLPNGRRASFYNFWGGRIMRPRRFRQRLASDLRSVIDLVGKGAVSAPIGARIPLTDAARALALAESGTPKGKVIITP
jgi:NADPH:quinone reductase-like Zn-dependent oxidoreductase